MKDQNQTLSEATRAKRPVRTQLWFDSIARATITSGGVGTILVAFLIVVVMISQLLPLFSSTELTPSAKFGIGSFADGRMEKAEHDRSDRSKPDNTHALCAGMDEYGDIVWILFSNGSMETYATATGQRLQSFSPNLESEGEAEAGSVNESPYRITCYSVADDDASLLIGYDNGAVRPVSIEWKVEFIDRETGIDSPLFSIDSPHLQRSVITALPNGLLRVQRIESVQFHDLIHVLEHPVRCIDWITPEAIYGLDKAKSWRWLASDGNEMIVQHHLRRRQGLNQATNEEIRTWRTRLDAALVNQAMLNAQGDGVITLNSEGLAQLWKLTPDHNFRLTASHWTIAGSDHTISSAVPILGRNTLLISTNDGQLEGVVPFFGAQKSDLLSIHRFPLSSNRITQLTPATNSRVASAVTEDGKATLVYIPTNRRLLDWVVEPDSQVFFSAGSRFLGTLSHDSVTISRLTLRFPEAG